MSQFFFLFQRPPTLRCLNSKTKYNLNTLFQFSVKINETNTYLKGFKNKIQTTLAVSYIFYKHATSVLHCLEYLLNNYEK